MPKRNVKGLGLLTGMQTKKKGPCSHARQSRYGLRVTGPVLGYQAFISKWKSPKCRESV